MHEIPLGKREDAHLEFKGRDSLRKPEGIGREVVAMLNAGKGEIWVGLTDDGGRAAAVEHIENHEAAIGSLRNHLIDTIDPSPTEAEFQIEPIQDDMRKFVLLITVKGSRSKRPYAQIRNGGRYYLLRIGDRLRPMTREEIARAYESSRGKSRSQLSEARSKLSEERAKLLGSRSQIFWMCVQPVEDAKIELSDSQQSTRLKTFLTDATATGNRPDGWVFASPYSVPNIKQGRIEQGSLSYENEKTVIRADGAISLKVALREMHWRGAANELWPYAVIEYPTSLIRLAKAVYSMPPVKLTKPVLVDFAFIGLSGWKLKPRSPKWPGFNLSYKDKFTSYEEEDLLPPEPLKFDIKEILDEPDRCALRMVRLIYQAFGYAEDKIPSEFDTKTGKLLFGG